VERDIIAFKASLEALSYRKVKNMLENWLDIIFPILTLNEWDVSSYGMYK